MGLILALFTGLVATASAQDSTPEATPAATSAPTAAATESIMDQVMAMPGACPPGIAGSMFRAMQLTMTPEATAAATESAMTTPMAPMDMSMMTPMATADMSAMTPEATMTMMGVTCLFGQFSGSTEVPAAANNAMGVVFVTVDPASGNVCYDAAVGGITLPATMAHIHQAAAGQSGNPVVPLDVAPDASGMASGCETVAPA
ncbi:MAG TPA: CHRD domain-containing protein, partial [Phototrophicaceae bacterium]|nr:CHRD domain-containing protein [Phototrophicaceae bacterium]